MLIPDTPLQICGRGASLGLHRGRLAVRRRITVALATVGMAAAAVVASPTAASAAPTNAEAIAPTVFPTVTPGPPTSGVAFTGTGTSTVNPCSSTILTGLGFQPNEPVNVVLGGTTVGTTTAETTGAISTTVTVPEGTAPGTYELIATGATGTSSTELIVGKGGCHLVLSHPSGSNTVNGSGCPAYAPVVLVIDRKVVGRTTASAKGRFSATITPPGSGIGQYTVTATCGQRTFDIVLAVVSTAKLSSPEAATAVFGVFVLLGIILLRGLFGGSGRRRRRKRTGGSTP